MSDLIYTEPDEDDGRTSMDLVVDKDSIREKARGRQLLDRAMEKRRRRRATEEAEAPREPNPLEQLVAGEHGGGQPQQIEGGSFLRHIDPVEGVGGFVEGALTDFVRTAEDLGAGAASLMGASPEDIEKAKGMGRSMNPLAEIADQIEIGDPESGSFIREIGNFAGSFMGAGKITNLKKLEALGRGGQLGSATIRGAIADFVASDESDGHLADLAEGTRFDNPMFDLLQTEEGQGALERRLKHSLEGVGMGLAFDGVVMPALRAAGKFYRAKTGASKAADLLEETEKAVAIQREDLGRIMGDPDAPLVSRAAPTPGGEPGGVSINFSRISSSDDVKQIIRELADSFSDSIGEAQRGVRTHATTREAAKSEDAFDLLVRTGQERGVTLNAEETLAMRELWVASGKKVQELAERVAAESASPVEEIAFRRQIAVHSAIQERVLAVRTETARALNQWRIPAGDTLEFSAQFDQMVAQAGSTTGSVQRMAKAITKAKAAGDIGVIDQLTYGSRWAKAGDAVGAMYYFSMLSGPHTHMRNLLSNSLMLGLSASERKLANLIGRSFGDEQVVTGETMAALNGIVRGAQDSFRISSIGRNQLKLAKEARKAGRPDEMRRILEEAGDEIGTFHKARVSGESGYGVNKVEASPISAFSPEKLGIEAGKSPMHTFAFHLARLMDAVTTMPGRALGAGDEVAKTINARMELQALSYRQAYKETGGAGSEEFAERYARLLESPDESMELLARNAAEVNTFTNRPMDSATWKAVSSIAKVPVVGKILMPFVRTPYNLATQSFRRTPLAIFSKSWREDLMAGGARADMALAQMAGGTAVMTSVASMAVEGRITGAGPPNAKHRAALQRMGWKPYAVRIGDQYISYRGLEPISTLLGMSADMTEMVMHMDYGDEDPETEALVTSVLFATMAQIQNKTYLQGLGDFFNAASSGSRAQYEAMRMVHSKAALVSPAILAHTNRALFDDHAREVSDIGDAIAARVPGMSNELPNRRDIWGREISYGSSLGGLYGFFSPLYASEWDPEPIDEELERLEIWLQKPRRGDKIGGENVDLRAFPEAYDDLVRLSGNDLTHDINGIPVDPMMQMGLKDTLNALVTGGHPLSDVYQMQPPSGRQEMILKFQRRFLDAAKDQVAQDHPELGALVTRRREEREAEERQQLRSFGR